MVPLDWMDVRADAVADAAPAEGGEGGLEVEALLEGLNEPQRLAASHDEGPLLILAGAGSGKTRVITRRIAWLIATRRVSSSEVLAITFTNKAAREMRERVEALLPARGMWISTFHAMCARILRRDIEALGTHTRGFSIYDTHDKNQLIKAITKELGYDTQRFRPAQVGGWISDWKTSRFNAEEDRVEAGFGGIEDEVLTRVTRRYAEKMAENNALDFDDLLVKTLELFERHPGIRDAYAHQFRYVLVDEYQDTNRIQYLLTRHLSSVHKNLAVCGDPDQSIYGWRGADIRNILDFERDFGAERRATVVKLEQNYRSTRCILEAAQGLVRHNLGRKEKDLWTEKENEHRITVLNCGNENDEANRIANEIHALRSQGIAPDQIAVFYRVNFMQRALERAMRLTGVPYQIVGGVEFYQRREVRDLIAYLQIVGNPRDDVACQRVLNVPARGVGEKSVGLLAAWAAERGLPLTEAVRSPEARGAIRGRAKAGLAAFAGLVERLAEMKSLSAVQVLDFVIEKVDYRAWLATGADADSTNREENVEELRTHAASYDAENPEGGVRGFLQEVALVSDVDAWEEEDKKVTLMTLHSSKGLEFPIVFVAGCEEELLPHALAMMDGDDEESGVEEERRLMYVGMTRAQDRLYLTHADRRLHFGETNWRRPSRFLAEIPTELVAGHVPEEEEEDVLGPYEAPAEEYALAEGDRVEHDHFGYGYVARLQGSGANARVTVDFTAVGSKVLLVQYANLKVVRG